MNRVRRVFEAQRTSQAPAPFALPASSDLLWQSRPFEAVARVLLAYQLNFPDLTQVVLFESC